MRAEDWAVAAIVIVPVLAVVSSGMEVRAFVDGGGPEESTASLQGGNGPS